MANTLHESLSAGARVSEHDGAQTVRAYSSPEQEFRALRNGCGVFELNGRAKSILTGKDRTRWLNGMVTNNIRDLAAGRGLYSFLLNPQGHILGDMNIYNRGEYLVVDTDLSQAEKVRSTLKRYIIMDDVQLSDATDKPAAIGVEGPHACEVLNRAGISFSAQEPMAIEDTIWQDVGISILHSRANGYEVWLDSANSTRVWEALIRAGAIPAGAEALEMWRIAAGIPRYGQDIRERELPQETGQQRALNFIKGCYIGQEIVERIRSRGAVHRMFTGFRFAGAPPAGGTKIEKDGREVGEITSVAVLPCAEGPLAVGLGYLRREVAEAETKLDVKGTETTVTVLPFSCD